MSDRRAELAQNLTALRERIAATGADPTVIVVTKFFPASDVASLVELGVTDMGENRDQEASAKVAELEELGSRPERVHFIGQLQTNKAASVAAYADVVHSVDRVKLVGALERGRVRPVASWRCSCRSTSRSTATAAGERRRISSPPWRSVSQAATCSPCGA
ncbi:hypothetical protein GCM10025883_20830 [Mobilicoccus caccae]|uniref:Alanine racemase N-terminal domain-containing protein n=1 Tax=Mobilicoccus caccae TaxID=1859295 RepID=A0ABQ6ITM1_9MICO|nr:hypothetical protein GCM10025883_20830 [Mobilicoccus caccae]